MGLFSVDVKAPVAALSGNEVDTSHGAVAGTRKYYRENLQGTTASSAAGPVRFSGKGWQKLKRGLTTDQRKVQLIPAIKSIIEDGNYDGRFPLYRERNDGIVAFHFFTGNVRVDNEIVQAGVSVGEDKFGNLFYNLNHDTDALWDRKSYGEDPGAPSSRLEARLPAQEKTRRVVNMSDV